MLSHKQAVKIVVSRLSPMNKSRRFHLRNDDSILHVHVSSSKVCDMSRGLNVLLHVIECSKYTFKPLC